KGNGNSSGGSKGNGGSAKSQGGNSSAAVKAGNGGGNSNKSKTSTAVASKGNSGSTSKAKSKSVTPVVAKPKTLDDRIGALHAVKANLQAYIHASPNSRIGRVATYAKALVAAESADEAVASATAALAAAKMEFDGAT